jgi:uncharacterized protein
MAEFRPDRRMDPLAAQFWAFTKASEFRLQRCDECGKFRWPPAPVCDGCLSEGFTWTLVSGRGAVLSWVVFHRQYFSEYPSGHIVVSLELDEGPIFITIPRELGDQPLAGGLEMELTWEACSDRFGDYNLPVFRPLRGEASAIRSSEASGTKL